MTLPNKLTILRMLMVPLIMVVYYLFDITETFLGIDLQFLIIAIIFALASFTDFLDGYIARKKNVVTTFGKFMDPLADKLIVTAALIILLDAGLVFGWVIITILAREFIVSGIRLVAAAEGKVIAASYYAKAKTTVTMIAIMACLISPLYFIGNYLIYLALVLTIISGVDYFMKNRKILLSSK